MTFASIALIAAGIVCLVVSGIMMYRMIPREGRAAPAWAQSEFGETGLALGQFTLMVIGFALVAKGVF